MAVVRGPRRPPARANPTKAPAKQDANKSTADSSKEGSGETTPAPVLTNTETETKPDAANKPAAEESDVKPETSETGNNPRAGRKSASRSSRKPPRTAKAEPAPENTQRLLIDVKDGSHIEYLMSNVKRVTVENGVVVILSKQGNMQRVPLTSIVRMSIGP